MTRFIVKFLLTALVLGAAVWYGLPRVYTALNPKEPYRVVIIETASANAQIDPGPEPEPELPTVIQPLPPAGTTLDQENTLRHSDPDYPAVARKGDPPMWGVTGAQTEALTLSGETLIPVPGGIPVAIFTEKTIGETRYMISRFLTPPSGAPGGKILIPRAALAVYTGDHTRLNAHDMQRLTRFFTLTALINQRATELQQALNNQNPHAAAYAALYDDYQKLIADQKRLAEARKQASGSIMVRIEDKLRELNARARVLQSELKTAQEHYKTWIKTHPRPTPGASWAGDSEIAAMIREWQSQNIGIERLTAVSIATLYLERRVPAQQSGF